jgi:hypothetical protein
MSGRFPHISSFPESDIYPLFGCKLTRIREPDIIVQNPEATQSEVPVGVSARFLLPILEP